jgi:hypothetical protein
MSPCEMSIAYRPCWESGQLDDREEDRRILLNLDRRERGCKDGTGSGLCPVEGFSLSGVELWVLLQEINLVTRK